MQPVPVEDRDFISIEEAIKFFELNSVKFRNLIKKPQPFVVRADNKQQLIVRRILDEVLHSDPKLTTFLRKRSAQGEDCSSSNIVYVPIAEKYMLTIKEAAEYFNIGINRLRELAEANKDNIAMTVGSRFLIKRKRFEAFIDSTKKL